MWKHAYARQMYVCIIDAEGAILVHRNLETEAEAFERAIQPYREDIAVAVECVFVWYWLADLCAARGDVRPGARAVYESHSRREGEEQPDRQREDRGTSS